MGFEIAGRASLHNSPSFFAEERMQLCSKCRSEAKLPGVTRPSIQPIFEHRYEVLVVADACWW
jgi:hypothetical protein